MVWVRVRMERIGSGWVYAACVCEVRLRVLLMMMEMTDTVQEMMMMTTMMLMLKSTLLDWMRNHKRSTPTSRGLELQLQLRHR